ncbi:MAG: cation-translocating P-type ATPase [Phycisphaerales bacterium]|nr:cation-translocating P-type ATPase [Phycisphaerales bacterium]
MATDTHHVHSDHDHSGGCCGHADEIQSERVLLLYLLGGVLLIAAFLARTVFSSIVHENTVQFLALIAAVALGGRMVWLAWKELMKGRASTGSLASLAIIASVAVGQYEAAGWLALILLVADQFLNRTSISAKRVIEELVKLTPNVARVVRDGQEIELPLGEVVIGDTVRVRPGENLSVDGTVINGRSTMDQASLTGEAAPHEVAVNDPVYAGTTNLSSVLDLRVTQLGSDTTIGKVSELIASAERTKTPRQLLIEQVASFYVPVAISLAFLAAFLTQDVNRAINVLIVACPGALLLSSPTAMVAAFAAAARLGVMIKEAKHLEAAADVDTVVFDKTGTITTGKFAVSRLAPAPGVEAAELLAAAATAEQSSNHPLARSIVATAAAARVSLVAPSEVEEIHGRGIRAVTPSGTLHVGRLSWLTELNPGVREASEAVLARIDGMSGVHVMRDGHYLGAVGLEDKVRPATKAVIDRLRELGVKRLAIFTGDRLSVAERVGRSVGVDMVEAECLPEEKHAEVQRLTRDGRRVLMVGDGINDGPSLAAADVGVAMGLSGSDIATNSAGVALMNDDLSRIPFLIELARRNRAIIAQNLAISVVVALVGLALATSGKLEVWQALVFHFLGDVLVIGNSFRLFRFGEAYSLGAEDDAEQRTRRAASMSLAQPAPQPA